jgi:hypothetical protein
MYIYILRNTCVYCSIEKYFALSLLQKHKKETHLLGYVCGIMIKQSHANKPDTRTHKKIYIGGNNEY